MPGGARAWLRYILLVALLGGATLALVCVLRARPAEFELRLDAKTEHAGIFQLYFDSGAGFNERQSIRRNFVATRDFRAITFRISAERLNRLRFDPPAGELTFAIRSAELRTRNRQIAIQLERFGAVSQIAEISNTTGALVVRTTHAATDAQIAIDVAASGDGDINTPRRVIATALLGLLVIGALGLAAKMRELRVHSTVRSLLLFPALCTVAAFALSAAGINGSSSAALLEYFPGALGDTGLLAGTARPVRSDEWLVHTPWLFSQARQPRPFSSRNPSVGEERAALVCNLPVAHWSMIFRPEFWAFLAHVRFDIAFAIFWNLKWWLLLCGTYTLLLVITRADPLLSASGALMLFFSSTIQWWFSTPTLMPDMIGFWCFAIASAFGAVAASQRFRRLVCAGLFVFCATAFVLCCYPRFQVPLASAAVPLLVAMFLSQAGNRHWLPLLIAAAVFAVFCTIFFWQIRETLGAIRELRYPGRILSAGGGESWTSVLRGFVTLEASEQDFPRGFSNVVAASAFLNPLPLLLLLQIFRWRRTRSVDPVQITVIAIGAAMFWFAICGVPAWFARITLWSYVTSERVVVPLAVIAVLALCRELNEPPQRLPRPRSICGVALIFALALYGTNRALGNFLPVISVIALCLYFTGVGALIAARRRFAASVAVLLPVVASGAGVNPLNRGLPAYRAPAVVRVMNEVAHKFSGARWIVLGEYPQGAVASSLFRTTGANVLSGTIAVPNRAFVRGLDPTGTNADVYSRYAAVAVVPGASDSIAPRFTLNEATVYTIELPLTQSWLRAASIDGVMLREQTNTIVPSGYSEVVVSDGWRVWIRTALLRKE